MLEMIIHKLSTLRQIIGGNYIWCIVSGYKCPWTISAWNYSELHAYANQNDKSICREMLEILIILIDTNTLTVL